MKWKPSKYSLFLIALTMTFILIGIIDYIQAQQINTLLAALTGACIFIIIAIYDSVYKKPDTKPPAKRFTIVILLCCMLIFLLVYQMYGRKIPLVFENEYYSVFINNYVEKLFVKKTDIVSTYKMFSCEENYKGKWSLDIYDYKIIHRSNESTLILYTISHLFTQEIFKKWTFYREENLFFVEINRTYTQYAYNLNNQIIIDVKCDNYSRTKHGIIYDLEDDLGYLIYEVVDISPDDYTIQTMHPTETQINFYNCSDRDMRLHRAGETEYIKFKVEIRHGN